MGHVSIIMPAYNCRDYIEDSIRSVLRQTYANWELIIVDDCSTDGTAELIQTYSGIDARIRPIYFSENRGTSVARNAAIELAEGKYLAFLDSDDLWEPDKLEKQLNFMKEHNAVFTCTSYRKIDENGQALNVVVKALPKADYWKCLYYGNSIGNSTAMLNVDLLGKVYCPDIKKRNDFALWLRVLKKGQKVIGIQEVLASYRVRKSSLSYNKFKLIKYQWQLYHGIEKLPMYQCLLAFFCLFIRKGCDAIKASFKH